MDETHLLKTYVGCGGLKEYWVNPYLIGFVLKGAQGIVEKKSLAGTIEPGPNSPHIIADVGAKHQVRLHRL